MEILGIKIDNFSKENIFQQIENFLAEDEFHQINTVNPEFILEAQKNQEFKIILNNSALNIADGIGIWFAFLRYGKYLRARIAGIDLMHEILHMANEKKLNIFLAANKNGLSTWEETRDALSKIYPNVIFKGADLNEEFVIARSEATKQSQNNLSETNNEIAALLSVARNDIVFCAFGAPSQEIFLNSLKNGRIRLAIGVGGSFDFLTGKVRRSPAFMRKLGLEWLWRFILEPKYRLKRIFNAVIIFPIRVLFNK